MEFIESRENRAFAFEVKFLTPRDQADEVRAWSRERLRSDPNAEGGSGATYRITSIYYDTAASDVFAVNPDARESELARIPVDELRQRWKGAQPEIIVAFSTADASVGVRGQEIWRTWVG